MGRRHFACLMDRRHLACIMDRRHLACMSLASDCKGRGQTPPLLTFLLLWDFYSFLARFGETNGNRLLTRFYFVLTRSFVVHFLPNVFACLRACCFLLCHSSP